MKALKILFCCHLLALTFGLAGLLIALPHPELWSKSPFGIEVFAFGMNYAGSLHILFGAATMLLFGLLFVGARKTLIFFAASTLISLSMELLGTSTGFPFGPYAYTNFLGIKILGLVPYAIPLSWFYMGFTSLLLANLLVARAGWSRQTLWSLLVGVYFLTVWDLSLDPAMASNHLQVHFWIWYESGPYFGMPVRNLVGWSITGLIYMSVSRFFWHENLAVQRITLWLPLGMYAANTCFAIVLNLGVGLWLPPLIGLMLGLPPIIFMLSLRHPQKPGGSDENRGQAVVRTMSHLTVHKGSQALLRHHATCSVEGVEHIPLTGPTLIVAHHYHHLLDGCALLNSVPRRLHILIAPDWIDKRWLRVLMEFACRLVEWPIVLRADRLEHLTRKQQSAYTLNDAPRYRRRAFTEADSLVTPWRGPRYLPRGLSDNRPLAHA